MFRIDGSSSIVCILHASLRSYSLHIILLALFVLLGGRLMAQPAGPATPIVLNHADEIVGNTANGDEIDEFNGHVSVTQGVVTIESDRAVLTRSTNHVVFTGNVIMTQPGVRLTAPQAEYDGLTKIATATGGVRIVDSGAVIDAASAEYNMNIRTATFRGGVQLRDSNVVLNSSTGEYYQDERRAVFHGGVRAESDSGMLVSRDLTYWRDSRESYAVGDAVLTPKYYTAELSGDTLRNQPARNYTLVLGRPKLVQVDTVDHVDSAGNVWRDTTVITARKMEAFRGEHEEYVGTDSVRLRRGDLVALAALGRYLPREEVIGLGPGVAKRMAGRGDSVVRDSVSIGGRHRDSTSTGGGPRKTRRDSTGLATAHRDTTARDSSGQEAVTGVRPVGRSNVGSYPVIWYGGSQLTGDSVTIGLAQKKLRTIDAMANAFAVTKGKLEGRYDQLAGQRIKFFVQEDTIRRVRSEGLASSIYFVYDSDQPNGVNRASGDTINVGFDQGQASQIAIFGKRSRSEGEYFPEKNVGGQETNYRLAGFVWIDRDLTADTLHGTLPRPSQGNAQSDNGDKNKPSGQSYGAHPR